MLMNAPRDLSTASVVVVAEQALVAETLGFSLARRGFACTNALWPTTPERARAVAAEGLRADFGVLLSDLADRERVETAVALVGARSTDWIVLSAEPEATIAGAAIEAGALAVVSTWISLDELTAWLVALSAGDDAGFGAGNADLVRRWQILRAERQAAADRVSSLSVAETDVLWMLYSGDSIDEVADRVGIPRSTVLSRIKSMLRKLEVGSRLAAVSVLAESLEFR